MSDRSSLQSLAGALIAVLAGMALVAGITLIAASGAHARESSAPPLVFSVVWSAAWLVSFAFALASLFVDRRGTALGCSVAPVIGLLAYMAALHFR